MRYVDYKVASKISSSLYDSMVDTTLLTVKMVHSSTTYWPATIAVSTVTTFTSSADDT